MSRIYTRTLFSSEAIAKSASSTTDALDLSAFKMDGKISLLVVVAGSGTATINYEAGIDGTFTTPGAESALTTDMVAGTDIIDVDPITCDAIKFKVTESGGTDPITVTLKVAFQ